MRLRQFRRRRESTSDIDEPHRARIGVIGVIQSAKFTKWACYAPRLDGGHWISGESEKPLGQEAVKKAHSAHKHGRGPGEDPPGEAPAASAAQATQGRAAKREASWTGWAGWQGNSCGVSGCGTGPKAGNKMEAMEAVERVEGFFGGWSLHVAIWLGRR